jgi:vancomycin resistance protein YoaR
VKNSAGKKINWVGANGLLAAVVFAALILGGCAAANHSQESGSHSHTTQSAQNTADSSNSGDDSKATQDPNAANNQSDNLQTDLKQPETEGGLLPAGTQVDDLDLSACSVSEAPKKLETWAEDKLEENRVLLYNGTEVPIKLKDLGVSLDTAKTMEEVQFHPGMTSVSVLKVESVKAGQVLKGKLKKFDQPAKDASYKIAKDKVVVRPAVNGRTAAAGQFLTELQKYPLSMVPHEMKVSAVEVPASVTTEAVKKLAFDSVLGEFTTKFAVREGNRSANLIAAAKALDRKLIRPGETFSFNNTVGPREPETGYKNAYVIINGEYVKGVGGGVCQVSSTLYNAVLLANLGIVERTPHAVAVSYVPPGQDATVNYPYIDFKFKNTTSSLIYLRTEIKTGVLTFKIWGKKTGKAVRLERQVLKVRGYKTERRYDPALKKGRIILDQIGSKGVVVKTWRAVQDPTGKVTKQFLGQDTYAPANRILRIGT